MIFVSAIELLYLVLNSAILFELSILYLFCVLWVSFLNITMRVLCRGSKSLSRLGQLAEEKGFWIPCYLGLQMWLLSKMNKEHIYISVFMLVIIFFYVC